MATKTMALDKHQASTLINDFFEQFQTSCNQSTPPRSSDFESILSPQFHIKDNEHTLARNLQEYVSHLGKLQQKYSHFKIVHSKEEPLVCDNRIAIQYELHATLRQGGQVNQMLMIAIATLENNHFKSWTEVVYHKNSGQPHWHA
ncbi:hypothetical protein [Candidatus Protochlamydia phocaeensis]|uniref:hypothetical protein n=1 Tax=Candidatus Protochlamydia phocaeensis TaxID=1414722 RepID=UPI000839A06B|nr:hypothetical protein [Candidatus Protochlamydia phocaeensis]